MLTDKKILSEKVYEAVNRAEITDIHTHIYPTDFGGLLLWGIDELLTYHYLIVEYFRYSNMKYENFFKLSKNEQANLIWQKLFVENSPVSEAQRGVLTVLDKLGLDVSSRDLGEFRRHFASLDLDEYVTKVFETAGVKEVVMTNDPFDPEERVVWEKESNKDKRFKSALRLDVLLNTYEQAYLKLNELGYTVGYDLDMETQDEIKRFLREQINKMKPLYLAVSLPPDFMVPEASHRSKIIEQCILPICREFSIPLAMMIGVDKLVNFKLGVGGDAVKKADIGAVEYLCKSYPDNKLMVTMLSKENQHELCVMARKFRNLLIFGCWWFLNNPSIVEEMTRMRMELLGLSFVPQHSDARVLDQLIYKWTHSRKIIAKVLIQKYCDILDSGWAVTETEIERDVENLFSNNFWKFINQD
ncbi:glucuronate isomerase [Desulfitibacter alkalitolerans]|uniref:glucuronate isomerase n=1 Tax=Desulfitibacter alkalitolerans TaxID=264641 RepID=UPI000484DF84|nr:glucuronate isomerase [Desulfitibacter alkalitolerans]